MQCHYYFRVFVALWSQLIRASSLIAEFLWWFSCGQSGNMIHNNIKGFMLLAEFGDKYTFDEEGMSGAWVSYRDFFAIIFGQLAFLHLGDVLLPCMDHSILRFHPLCRGSYGNLSHLQLCIILHPLQWSLTSTL